MNDNIITTVTATESNNFTTQQRNNFQAKQRLNNEYQKLNGAENTEQTVGFFTKHNKVFQFLAVLFSAIGIYFDLLSLVGVIGSILIGLAVGVFIEFGKDRLSKGLFNTSIENVSRFGLVGGTLFIIMLIALLLHIRSINNFVGTKAQTKTARIYQDEIQLQKDTSKINLELAKALNNGSAEDDIISAHAITSNNNRLELAKNSEAKTALLNLISQNKNTLSGILYLLFMSVEFFSLFGIFGMLIIQRNTDGNVKSLVTTSDKLNNIQANVYQATETMLINNTLNNIAKIQEGVNHPTPTYSQPTNPTLPPQNSVKQEQKAQIAFNANSAYKMPTNSYFMGIQSNNGQETNFLPKINKRKPTSSGTRTETNQTETEETTEKNSEVLDLLKFSHIDTELIKILWENGTVKEGDKLLSKRFVLKELPRTITERDLINLYEKLVDYNYIEFKNGYRALVDMENVTAQKVIG